MSAKTVPHGKSAPATRSTPAEAASKTPLHPPTPSGAPAEDAIRARAYHLWQQAGYPEGDGTEFWFRAEKELTNPQ
jgi:hypothetical protein